LHDHLENFITATTRPFRISFRSDANEATTGAGVNLDELASTPRGIIGFELDFFQVACP